MADHPYTSLPDQAFWRRSVAAPPYESVDPVGIFDLRITPQTKVCTAGSCFAQHIARHLQKSGYNYYVAEPGHPIIPERIRKAHNYGLFSARYGNIYTARQLLQLFQRAYGAFEPKEPAWVDDTGTVVDPFRPTVQPKGFVSVAEMLADRRQHLAAVRDMFRTLDVFVFTFGLTECWAARADGAVFPLCPGVEGGTFDPDNYVFVNEEVQDVVSEMSAFIDGLRSVNRSCQVVLTVSPVPLVATAVADAHVLASTTYSKAVLRVSAETLQRRFNFVHYFPSYEIITGAFNRGRYFASDLRNVTEEGIAHVMRLFLQHAAGDGSADAVKAAPTQELVSTEGRRSLAEEDFLAQAEKLVQVECDEVALDSSLSG